MDGGCSWMFVDKDSVVMSFFWDGVMVGCEGV